MTNYLQHQADPELDLEFERIVALPAELIWAAWTTPEHLLHWFTPAPWKTIACEIDLRPGGIFSTLMQSPEGQEFPNVGCYLEIVPNQKLVWTNALAPGFRPSHLISATPCDAFPFTAVITLEPHPQGTRYRALVMHRDAAGRQQHADMGFQQGWGSALDQLVAYMNQRSD